MSLIILFYYIFFNNNISLIAFKSSKNPSPLLSPKNKLIFYVAKSEKNVKYFYG